VDQKIQHFLLIFDHDQGELLKMIEFGTDSDAAVAAYAESERVHKDLPRVEIVLIGSDSFETVKLTHANYFDGTVALSKYLTGIG
jgi:hypothetical protein